MIMIRFKIKVVFICDFLCAVCVGILGNGLGFLGKGEFWRFGMRDPAIFLLFFLFFLFFSTISLDYLILLVWT